MPVGDCGDEAGVTEIPYVGTLCFFLLQQVAQGPNPDVFGEFVEGCEVNGTAGPLPTTGPGPYVLQLYKDPDRVDS